MRKRAPRRDEGPRANSRIRAPRVRVVLQDGEMLGVMSSRDAYAEAQQRGLDLVEISPNANPPVCKIMDYGKYKYELKKKGGVKKTAGNILKEITLSPVTQEHDLNFKTKNAIKFLEEGHRVKFTVRFRGRQMAHPEIGRQQIQKIAAKIADYGVLEVQAKMEGRFLGAIFAPAAGKPKATSKAPKTPKTAKSPKTPVKKEAVKKT